MTRVQEAAERLRLLGASVRGDRAELAATIHDIAVRVSRSDHDIRASWVLRLLSEGLPGDPLAVMMRPADLDGCSVEQMDALIFWATRCLYPRLLISSRAS